MGTHECRARVRIVVHPQHDSAIGEFHQRSTNRDVPNFREIYESSTPYKFFWEILTLAAIDADNDFMSRWIDLGEKRP